MNKQYYIYVSYNNIYFDKFEKLNKLKLHILKNVYFYYLCFKHLLVGVKILKLFLKCSLPPCWHFLTLGKYTVQYFIKLTL